MLKNIYKVLPVFVIIWLAKRHCESFAIQGWLWRSAFEDVLIREERLTKPALDGAYCKCKIVNTNHGVCVNCKRCVKRPATRANRWADCSTEGGSMKIVCACGRILETQNESVEIADGVFAVKVYKHICNQINAQPPRVLDVARCVAKTGRYMRHLYKHDICVRCGTPRQ